MSVIISRTNVSSICPSETVLGKTKSPYIIFLIIELHGEVFYTILLRSPTLEKY